MFSVDEKEWAEISKVLLTKRDDGSQLIDSLMQTGDCPLCLSEVDEGKAPFIVDQAHLQFHCLVCNFSGGPINYIALTKKKGKNCIRDAMQWLKSFIRS